MLSSEDVLKPQNCTATKELLINVLQPNERWQRDASQAIKCD